MPLAIAQLFRAMCVGRLTGMRLWLTVPPPFRPKILKKQGLGSVPQKAYWARFGMAERWEDYYVANKEDVP